MALKPNKERHEPILKKVSMSHGSMGTVRKKWGLVAGAIIVLGVLSIAGIVFLSDLLGIRITPYDPLQQNVGPYLAGPSFSHLFGTDLLGRDLFSRVVVATPNDIGIGIAVIAVSLLVGVVLGSLAALAGGLSDELLMRVTDVFFALPVLVLAMAISIAVGPGVVNMMFVLMIIWWPPYARLARGESLRVSHQNYIEAARLSGLGRIGILFKHVIPNIFVTMMVYATVDIGGVILVYSGLSYLGLSVRPPQPDWGEMVASYQSYMLSAPWLPLLPGLIIAVVVIGFSVLGDGLRDALEVS
jgi:peptide/nickel transport system permease protein